MQKLSTRRESSVQNRKADETEWSRYSRAFAGRDSAREEYADPASEPSAPTPSYTGPVSRQPIQESAAPAPAPRAAMSDYDADLDDDVESVIGEQSSFEGTFRSDNSVRVRGSVQGELESKRSVYIEERAKINAKVTGASIVVGGEVDGQLHCDGRVEIKPSGRVTGEIHAGTLIMHEGAFFEGQLKMVKQSSQPVEAAV